MAASEETGGLFLIFILTMMAIPLVPYTLVKLCRAAKVKAKSAHCQCQLCVRLGKNQKSLYKRISNLSTYNNVMLLFLWIIMAVLVYYIRHSNREVEVFEPFNILGLDTGASDSEIKKAYRRLSIQYHPDKNPDPEAHKYFVEYISKAYQALTDPISRENFDKYGHPDGRQGFQMGIALPQFLLNIDGSSGGVLLLGIVGVCILMPLVMAVIYLSRSSKYTGNYVMHYTQSTYYYCMKPSLAPSKVMDLFAKASEYMEIPVRREDEEPLKKLFVVVRGELNHEPKNVKQENTKFWKQHPAQVKTELLIQAHLTRRSEALSSSLSSDSRRVLELSPPLLEELIKIALVPRSSQGGWLRPAVGAIELSQSIVQAVPLSARKAAGGSVDGIAPFLQLPHFTESTVKRITRRRVRTLQDLIEIGEEERSELLRVSAGMSAMQVGDVEAVLGMIPAVSVDVAFETEGEEGGIQEGDVVTMHAWVSLRRGNGAVAAVPHAPHFPFHKEENFWILLSNSATNDVWLSQKISFSDEDAAAAAVAKAVQDSREGSGASAREIKAAVVDAVARVRSGSRLVMAKFQAPREGAYALVSHCLCDSWIGCDRRSPVKIRVLKRSAAPRSAPAVDDASESAAQSEDDDDGGAHNYDDDYESEYSDDEDDDGAPASADNNNNSNNNNNNLKKTNGCLPVASASDLSDC